MELFSIFIFWQKLLAFAKFLSDSWPMNKPHYLVLYVTLSIGFLGCQKDVETVKEHIDQAEKPIQHLKLKDIASESNAVEVMQSTTEQLRAKTNLNALELHEIHMITYSMEKAVAFFAENLSGARQVIAQEMTVSWRKFTLALRRTAKRIQKQPSISISLSLNPSQRIRKRLSRRDRSIRTGCG